MAQKRAVKKSGKKTKPRSRSPLAAAGKAKSTKKAVGAKKKSARKAVVKSASRGTKKQAAANQTRKGAGQGRTTANKGAKKALKKVARKAAGPLPRKMTAQKKRAASSTPKPRAEVGVREVQSTAPAIPVGMGAAPDANPLNTGDQPAVAQGGGAPATS